MKGLNRKQLRDHYVNFLKNKSTSSDFSPAEDAFILTHVKRHGHSWKHIAAKLPGRSPIAIKNRYYKVLAKKGAQGEVSKEEVGQRVSTGNCSTGERVSEDRGSLNEQVQVLITQEEKLIKGIKIIEDRISKLKVANKCNLIVL
eukprot:TRINITY_DN12539_c0_g1_i2.p1 TRINITY_DN12539_c0_g1~~TRINITY_DN12539_c0_g1_i2.p1  ORF type:complete len:144 (+),score=36.91 TRINITY_DN12539_c0_g1_i2:564-995(+)